MAYAIEIYDAINAYFEENDWQRSFDPVHGSFRLDVELECALKKTAIVLLIEENDYLVYATVRPLVPPEKRAAAAEFLTRMNYGLPNGNFEMDFDDGEVHYKTFVNCRGGVPSPAVIHDSMMAPISLLENCGGSFLDVLNSVRTPKEAAELGGAV